MNNAGSLGAPPGGPPLVAFPFYSFPLVLVPRMRSFKTKARRRVAFKIIQRCRFCLVILGSSLLPLSWSLGLHGVTRPILSSPPRVLGQAKLIFLIPRPRLTYYLSSPVQRSSLPFRCWLQATGSHSIPRLLLEPTSSAFVLVPPSARSAASLPPPEPTVLPLRHRAASSLYLLVALSSFSGSMNCNYGLNSLLESVRR
ncbi:hypothetical protein BJX63DRAFT_370689 [Aspergillus granulosus]|uniref:Transmembrane protein n=1 Tax=Aspergillus granulosus TaxID=176169 RepID=A0ABR4H1B5_9EURO